jgi:hypothetical protein
VTSLIKRLAFDLKLARERIGYRISVPLECRPHYPTGGRDSPYASLRFQVGGEDALLCYGRPSVRGRDILGTLVPFGELWRTGANEPTTIHLPFRASVAGIDVPKGVYSLYTVPGEQWLVVINRSTSQSGRTRDERGKAGNLFPNAYTTLVAAAEVGRAPVSSRTCDHVEQLTFRAEHAPEQSTHLVLAWERTEVTIPFRHGG